MGDDVRKLRDAVEVADDLACCIAMIQRAIGQGKDVFIEPDTKRKLSDARARLEAFYALILKGDAT